MKVSDCCGAPTKVEYQSDPSNFYDDPYDFRVPVRTCTQCGKVIEQKPIDSDKKQEENLS